MEPRLLGFLATVTVLSLLLHLWLALRLTAPLAPGRLRRGIRVALGVHAVFMPCSLLLMPLSGRPWADALQVVGWTTTGFWSLLFIFQLARDLLWGAVTLLDRAVDVLPSDPERRAFLQRSLNGGVAVLAGTVGTAAAVRAQLRPVVERVRIPIPDLPEALSGLRIAQVSDLHVGPTVRRHDMERVVAAVQALAPDLVAVTGDLVDGPVAALAPHVAPLAALGGPLGCYFVTGNHEYYSGAEAWCDHVRSALGMTVLVDEHVVVERDGHRVLVAGVADLRAKEILPSHRSDPAAAIAGAPPCDLRLLLAHQPESIDQARDLGFHLQLSGHTHGGQYVPFTWLIRLVKRFVAGLHDVDGTWVYVNRGTTWWGPPMRLGSPQEITLLELVRA